MPFKSKAQQRFMFATQPKTAEKWAKETPNMEKLPQKVKKENMNTAEPLDNIQFWVVMKPTSYESTVQDIMAPADPFQFCEMHKNGLAPNQVAGFFTDEAEASKKAEGMLNTLYEAAKALEEKKGEVSGKLQKTIDALQKKAEEHMKMVKKEPENADKHHEQAEKAMARIKELRGKHKMVEESKKEVKEMDYTKSGLKDPKKADLDKNKDISKYEQKRGKAIEKSTHSKK